MDVSTSQCASEEADNPPSYTGNLVLRSSVLTGPVSLEQCNVADGRTIALGGIDLREIRVDYTSGVVERRVVRDGRAAHIAGRSMVRGMPRHPNLFRPYGLSKRSPRLQNRRRDPSRDIGELGKNFETLTMSADPPTEGSVENSESRELFLAESAYVHTSGE
ncbi:hypothetical protein B0H14DRAFT_2727379, partial [Mycena olivaceomarginata]